MPCPPAQLTLLGPPKAMFGAAGRAAILARLLEGRVARVLCFWRETPRVLGQGAVPSAESCPAPEGEDLTLSCGEDSAGF